MRGGEGKRKAWKPHSQFPASCSFHYTAVRFRLSCTNVIYLFPQFHSTTLLILHLCLIFVGLRWVCSALRHNSVDRNFLLFFF
jgi:hypothetical protein